MNLRNFFEYMKTHDIRYLKILVLIVIFLLLLVNVCSRVEKVRALQTKQYNEQLKALQKVDEIQTEYEQNKKSLDSGILKRPLEKSKIETYQARLLNMLEQQHIQIQNVTALKTAQKDRQTPFIEYEANWIGNWKNIMSSFKTMETEPIAINFSSIKIEAGEHKELVKAVVKYRIYIYE